MDSNDKTIGLKWEIDISISVLLNRLGNSEIDKSIISEFPTSSKEMRTYPNIVAPIAFFCKLFKNDLKGRSII